MRVAIIDADLIHGKRHRFPNLCSMKISAWHKKNHDDVELKTDYENLELYDKVYISKVFVQTEIPGEPSDKRLKNEANVVEWYSNNQFLKQPNIIYGGTGFFFDRAPQLPHEIEHCMPDYHLYDEYVYDRINTGAKRSEFKYYLDYSIGYLTRRCFRGCQFCVNKAYNQVVQASSLTEFLDKSRPNLCFLDDNFFGYRQWGGLIDPVIRSGKKFQFKQGLDERLLTEETIRSMANWRYDGYLIFAFDNVYDELLIRKKLDLIYQTIPNWNKHMMFYVLCGFDRNRKYDKSFWLEDIKNTFRRIKILSEYKVLPYIMRHENIEGSGFESFYSNIAAWCNQPSFFKKKTFREFCIARGETKSGKKGASWRELERIERLIPDVAELYFDFVGMR